MAVAALSFPVLHYALRPEIATSLPLPLTATRPRFIRRFAVTTDSSSSLSSGPAPVDEIEIDAHQPAGNAVYEDEEPSDVDGVKEYFAGAKDLIRPDGGPPRWFSPLVNGGSCSDNAPLLLYLPGIDGIGLGLVKQHRRLAKFFHVWCLHIPVHDRTSFTGLKNLVETTVRSESLRIPSRPIYIVGESLGACLALAVASHNPDIDLVLILANPATSFKRSLLHSLTPLLEAIPYQPYLSSVLNSIAGNPLMMALGLDRSMPLLHAIDELPRPFPMMSSFVSFLTDILPAETLSWKLKMLKSASSYANSRLHAVRSQTLILSSGKDQLQPSQDEAERLCRSLSNCDSRRFDESGHFLFLEDSFELLSVIKGAALYRSGRVHNFVSDYVPPTPFEFQNIYSSYRWLEALASPVMLSTLQDGKIARGLAGLPSEGPVLYVGYHMLLGLELVPLVSRILIERNIHVRGIAHPLMFDRKKDGLLPDLSTYDSFRLMGAVPVSATNFYRLFSSKSHVLLYPGGMREALHRKGEEYKLFWPEQSEFVRMAARFGATIVPFGTVGEDDLGEVIFDYDDIVKIPYLKALIERLTSEAVKLRTDASGEVSNQDVHFPGIRPKFPGRFYYLFGKPIETKGLHDLKDREITRIVCACEI
ncbi:hypothetical protein QQ045_012401 [Rhodiola kirilowii]